MQGTIPGAQSQARKTTHGLDGQHQCVDRTPGGRVNKNDRLQRTDINGESTSMVWLPLVGGLGGRSPPEAESI